MASQCDTEEFTQDLGYVMPYFFAFVTRNKMEESSAGNYGQIQEKKQISDIIQMKD